MPNAEPEEATKSVSFTATIHGIVPEGLSSAASISDILAHVLSGSTIRGRVRAALMRLAKKKLIVKTRQPSTRGGGDPLQFYRSGEALTAVELAARLRPSRSPRQKTPLTGKVAPQIAMRISPWVVDEFGILTRTITGIDAPAEVIAPMQAAGRAGGMASARARKATKPAKPVLSSPASIGSP